MKSCSMGRYALPDGPEPLSRDSPGILDRDDEVTMMLADLGDRASSLPHKLPPDALEIENGRCYERCASVCLYRGRCFAAA